jgi:hypothetical protein
VQLSGILSRADWLMLGKKVTKCHQATKSLSAKPLPEMWKQKFEGWCIMVSRSHRFCILVEEADIDFMGHAHNAVYAF